MDCTLCPIHNWAFKPCQMGTGKKSARIMFIADQPTDFENENNKWMIGKAGLTVRTALESLGIDVEKDCYFTGAIKCPTPDDRPPTRDEIENCFPYLEAEIEIVNPEIIVPMGNVALKAVLGYTGITKFRGKAVEKGDRIIFPIVHPSQVFRQPVHAKKFAKDLQNLGELLTQGKAYLEKSDVEYEYLETVPDIIEGIERLKDSEWLVFDLETTGLNPWDKGAKIVCISLTDRDHAGITIPLAHRESPLTPEEQKEVVEHLRILLENDQKKMAYNGKFDIKWLNAIYGIVVKNFAFDPFLAHYLAVSEERGNASLKDLAWEHTDMGGYDNELDAFKETLPEEIRHNYDNIPWVILREYASADVDCTYRVFEKLFALVYANEKWAWVYDNLLIQGSYTLSDMEINGLYVSKPTLDEFLVAFPKRIEEIENKLREFPEVVEIEREKHKMFETRQLEMKKPKDQRDPEILKWNKFKNFEFNFGSPVQLRELLFDKLGLTTPFLTDKATDEKRRREKRKLKYEPSVQEFSTGKETLEYLEKKHPIATLLSEWKKLDKLFGTYVSPAQSWIKGESLIHPTFNLAGTVTGRLSSEAPNAQNFPRKSNNPFEFQYTYGIKKIFTSRFGDDGVILQFDYSQLELRIAAIFSQDPALLEAYRQGKDMHIFAAAAVRGIPEEEVTDDMRTAAKAVNFGLIYGKGFKSLAVDMKMTDNQAKEFIDKYFEKFAGVKRWLDDMKKSVEVNKYVELLTGRWRRLPGIDSNDRGIQSDCYRQAVNAPVQGSGAEMTLLSNILINKAFKERNLKTRLCITVHDSIVADVHISEFEEVFRIMKDIMENLPYEWINVPIVSEAEVGRDYGTLAGINDPKELEEFDGDIFKFIDAKVQDKHEKNYKKAKEAMEKKTA